jgi:hypothetical protein
LDSSPVLSWQNQRASSKSAQRPPVPEVPDDEDAAGASDQEHQLALGGLPGLPLDMGFDDPLSGLQGQAGTAVMAELSRKKLTHSRLTC